MQSVGRSANWYRTSRAITSPVYAQVAETGQSIRFESHARALQRWFDTFAFRIGEPGQRRVALLFTDVTERRFAQNAIAERERQLSEAQRLAAIGFLVLGCRAKIEPTRRPNC